MILALGFVLILLAILAFVHVLHLGVVVAVVLLALGLVCFVGLVGSGRFRP